MVAKPQEKITQLHPAPIKVNVTNSCPILIKKKKKMVLGRGLKWRTVERRQQFALWPVVVISFDVALFTLIYKQNL